MHATANCKTSNLNNHLEATQHTFPLFYQFTLINKKEHVNLQSCKPIMTTYQVSHSTITSTCQKHDISPSSTTTHFVLIYHHPQYSPTTTLPIPPWMPLVFFSIQLLLSRCIPSTLYKKFSPIYPQKPNGNLPKHANSCMM